MPAAIPFQRISKAELFTRLAGGHASGATVVTPNQRLALTLAREFDDDRAAGGLAAWDSADILPISAFVERAYDDALHSDAAAGLPFVLTPAQEQALWETVVRESRAGDALLAVAETARLACEAWRLVQAWRLQPRLAKLPLDDDGKAYSDWARRYERIAARDRHTDTACLADRVAPHFGRAQARVPRLLACYGFDAWTPQQSAFLEALQAAGCEIVSAARESRQADVMRVPCTDAGFEIRRAANWARSQLEAGHARIGVVVPDLAGRRAEIVRAFSAVMAPDYALPGAQCGVLPFNVSIGVALSDCPLVAAALRMLELAGPEIDFERASRLIRSPFLAGAEAEMAQRAQLDALLRERAEPAINLDRLRLLIAREADGCPVLAQRIAALADYRAVHFAGRHTPSEWARRMLEAFAAAGFPGERSLDSAEYQTLAKWHAVVAAFAALDRVVPRIQYADAVARLRRMAADTLFQPETPDVPIQILGVLEAAGMTFDRLWVMGLTDEAWPPAPRPNPFLPVELQRAAGLPQSSAADALARARELTQEWLTAADEVVLSHPQRENDRVLKPSPLVAAVAERMLATPPRAVFRDAVHAARALESAEDRAAPALDGSVPVRGGTTVIKDQAACPFRAFARHRLGADRPRMPHAGLDALERGTLVHRVLALAWSRLGSKDALDAMPAADLEALLDAAAEDAIARIRRDRPTTLSGRFAGIERQRLTRLARAWLAAERERAAFTVVATEDKRRVEIGGLAFQARLDRLDELPDGRRIVIDYKTGKASPGAMLGERPDEPQLPLYLVATEPDAAAVAFARVRAGDMGFAGLARDGDLLPDVKAFTESKQRDPYATWEAVVEAWRADLARLGAAFVAGAAAVDPKTAQSCRYCDVQPFCRIHERLGDAPEDEADEA